MKTLYKKPELTIVNINKPCLLASSIKEGDEYSGTKVLGKGGGFWSDDEPEDEDYYE